MDWLKENRFRSVWIIVSIIISYLYISSSQNNIDSNNHILGLCWLKASIIIFIVISGMSFIISGIISKDKSAQQIIGLIIGFVLYCFLLLSIVKPNLYINSIPIFKDEFTQYSLIILITSVILLLIDILVGMDISVIEMDIAFIISTVIILKVVPALTPYDFSKENFSFGFQSGSIAFQLIIFNLLFNPNLYFKAFKISH